MSAEDEVGPENGWREAADVLALYAIDPLGTGGVVLRGGIGPARDAWLTRLEALLPEGAPMVRVPPHVPDGRLVGGLDLAATLSAGRPIEERGLLAAADGGTIVLPMAERIAPSQAAKIVQAIDLGEVRLERDGLASRRSTQFGVIALDEGQGEETPPASLLDRLGFHLDLSRVRLDELEEDVLPTREEVDRARARRADVALGDDPVRLLCEASVLLGVDSLGAVHRSLQAARAVAARAGAAQVSESHALVALRLVLLPRATRLPAPETESEPVDEDELAEASDAEDTPPPEESSTREDDEESAGPATEAERLVAAALASMPPDLLARLEAAAGGIATRAGAGRRGAAAKARRHGRPVGSRRGMPGSGVRLDLLETLRAAAPWQRLRQAERRASASQEGRSASRIEVRRDDFRVTRTRPRSETTTIFAVDASGSTAVRRLAEAKGAVERLLAQSYVRRDRVALIAFRGRQAELLLPPTRSLVRAKRELAALPGGGGTPLAAGIEAACLLAEQVRREGGKPIVVLLSDGQANVALDGTPGRGRAGEEASVAASRLRRSGEVVLFVDTSPRTREPARALADEMGARYMLLPVGRSDALASAARSAASSATERPPNEGGAPLVRRA